MSSNIYYTIYKVTNLLDSKYYIGKHMTKNLDDGYMGSGKLIRRAIKKHGIENFKKEILHVFDDEETMNAKEAELVIVSEETYNLTNGGLGSWSHINSNEELRKAKTIKAREITNQILQQKYGYNWRTILGKLGAKANLEKNGINQKWLIAGQTSFLGKKHTDESKKKIGKANCKNTGEKNSQYGTMWITDGEKNKKIKKTDLDFWIKKNWRQGRMLKSGAV